LNNALDASKRKFSGTWYFFFLLGLSFSFSIFSMIASIFLLSYMYLKALIGPMPGIFVV